MRINLEIPPLWRIDCAFRGIPTIFSESGIVQRLWALGDFRAGVTGQLLEAVDRPGDVTIDSNLLRRSEFQILPNNISAFRLSQLFTDVFL
jgi:hypothetical protein